MNLSRVLIFSCLILTLVPASVWADKTEFELNSRDDKKALLFTPTGPGKLVLSGKWEGSAKAIEASLYSPTQWIALNKTVTSKNPFELSWDLSEKDIGESTRSWKVILRVKSGQAKGDAEITGDAVESAEDKEGKKGQTAPGKGKSDMDMEATPAKEEAPPIPLDEFGQRARRTFLETPFYKPWVDKMTAGKKNAKVELRPLGLLVTPAVRKIQSRYGQISLTVRNITLTPAQNVNLMESISGSVETKLELLIRVEVPGWHLIAFQLAPFAAYPGEPPRLTAMEVETRSLSRGEIQPATSYPLSGVETILLVPVLFSQPGEYLFTGRPIAREQAEILFVLGGIELYRLSS